ncbi:MAG TPA: cation transporter [Candidatus Limiplasma sp.]|nr:cation transporter [Candidatus Limiplasma sp.]
MKKTFSISDLNCAACANALEKKLSTITGVKSVSINFFLEKLTLEADDDQFDVILQRVKRVVDHSFPGAVLT